MSDQSNQSAGSSESAPDDFVSESIAFPDMSPATAEIILKRLGGGVAEKHRAVEGVGFRAYIEPQDDGVSVEFVAHEELLDDLIRRFEDMADKEL
jgi:hypothetical protein